MNRVGTAQNFLFCGVLGRFFRLVWFMIPPYQPSNYPDGTVFALKEKETVPTVRYKFYPRSVSAAKTGSRINPRVRVPAGFLYDGHGIRGT